MGLLTGDTLASLALALVIFVLLVDLMHRRVSWAPRYPPGPRALPVLGNLLEFDFQNMNYSMSRLRSCFGDVFTLKMGWTPIVVLNGLVAIREALVHHTEDTSDRFIMPMDTCFGWGTQSQGVVQARYGQVWREQRRFCVSTMRNFGLGKKSLEQWVTEEAGYLCEAFSGHAGRPFSPNVQLNKAVSNVISSLIYARRFEYQDPRFTRMLQLIDAFMKEHSGFLAQVLNAAPVLLKIPGLPAKIFPGHTGFIDMLDELIAEQKDTWDPTQPPRNLIDAFLEEVGKGTMLLTNLSSVLKDENVWAKPRRFHPEHFLDAQGHFVKHEAFMPFSAGRRACLGEPLARMELFLFFTCLLQRFSFSVPTDQPRPSDHGITEGMVIPPPYELCAVSR